MTKLLLLARFVRKVGVGRIVYNILRRVVVDQVEFPDLEWKTILAQLNPDFGGTCLCKNEIAPKEDRVNLEIIIPVYNTEKYVKDCVDSALNQVTKYTFRVIIVNDGSTDGSPDIIKGYANDSRVRVIHQENRGLSGARNKALEYIAGDYVMFLDSDDSLPEDAVEKLLSKAYEGGYDIVGGGYIRFDNTKYWSKTIPQSDQLYGFAWGKVYRASLWRQICFPINYWHQDTVCALIIHDLAQTKTSIQEVVYNYRVNQKSISFVSRGNPKTIDTLWITLQLIRDRQLLGLPSDSKFLDRMLTQYKVNTWRIYTLDNEQANYANYLASKEIYLIYCKNRKSQAKINKPIEDAIFLDNYKMFLLACLLL